MSAQSVSVHHAFGALGRRRESLCKRSVGERGVDVCG